MWFVVHFILFLFPRMEHVHMTTSMFPTETRTHPIKKTLRGSIACGPAKESLKNEQPLEFELKSSQENHDVFAATTIWRPGESVKVTIIPSTITRKKKGYYKINGTIRHHKQFVAVTVYYRPDIKIGKGVMLTPNPRLTGAWTEE